MFQKDEPKAATVLPVQRTLESSPAKEVKEKVARKIAVPVVRKENSSVESTRLSLQARIWSLEKEVVGINNSTERELAEIKARTELRKKNFAAFALAQAKAERQEENAKAKQKLNKVCENIQSLRKENAGLRAANKKKEKATRSLRGESESLQNANKELKCCVDEAKEKNDGEILENKKIHQLLSAFKNAIEGMEIKVEQYTTCAQAENRIRRKYEQLCGDVLTLAAEMEQTELAFEFVEQIEGLAFQLADANLLTPPTVSFSEVGEPDPVCIEEVPCVHPVESSVYKHTSDEVEPTECETEFDEDVYCEIY